MTLHQITANEWNSVLSKGGKAQPGDVIELLPGTYTGQDFKVFTPGVTVQPAGPGVIFDGQYKWPIGTTSNTGPTGLTVTMEGLIEVCASDVSLLCDGVQIINTRGKGVYAHGVGSERLKNITIAGFRMDGLRHAPVRLDNVDGFKVLRIAARDFGNYFPKFRPGSTGGWPMGVNCVNCTNGEMAYCSISDGWGEGINASRGSTGIKIHDNYTHRLMGVHYYLHGASDVECWNNFALEDGRYLRSGSPPDLFTVNPGELQYEGQQDLGARNIRLWNNIAVGGFHNLSVWAGGVAKLDNCEWIHNTSINAKPGAKGTGHGAVLVRGGSNIIGLTFVANMIHQADGRYGEVAKGANADLIGNQFDGNGWDTLPPPSWKTKNDILHVHLRDPDGDPNDLGNFEPTIPAGLLTDTGVDEDFTGLPRRVFYSVGALEFLPQVQPPVDPPTPPLPTTETIGLMLTLDVDPAVAAGIRDALKSAKVTVS